MNRKSTLNFFNINDSIEDLPVNELFKLKGGSSDTIDGGELEEVIIDPPEDPWEDEWPDNEEDPWGEDEEPWEEPDWWDDNETGGPDPTEQPDPEEPDDECTCSQGIIGQGSGVTWDSTNLSTTLTAAIKADLANPNTNQSMRDTLNSIQTTLDRIGNSNFNLNIRFGDANGSEGMVTLENNSDLFITLDQSKLVYTEDINIPGTNIVMHNAGDFNYSLANEVLVHEIKHVEQFLDGRIGFDMFDNTKILLYGIEDEVEAFSFAHNFVTGGNPTEQIDQSWVRNQEIKYTDADGKQQTEKPYQNLGNGGNCPVHGSSSNPNG